jgi:hypothetical protein
MRLPCELADQSNRFCTRNRFRHTVRERYAARNNSGSTSLIWEPETIFWPTFLHCTGCWLFALVTDSAQKCPVHLHVALALRRHIWTTCDNARACRQATVMCAHVCVLLCYCMHLTDRKYAIACSIVFIHEQSTGLLTDKRHQCNGSSTRWF